MLGIISFLLFSQNALSPHEKCSLTSAFSLISFPFFSSVHSCLWPPQGLHSREAALGNTPPPTIRYVGVAGRVFSLPPLLAQPPNSPADVRLPSSWFPEPSFCWLSTNLFCRETGQPAAACPALSCVCRCRALPEGAALTH